MQIQIRPLAFVVAGLTAGCAGHQEAARYAWLHKQGHGLQVETPAKAPAQRQLLLPKGDSLSGRETDQLELADAAPQPPRHGSTHTSLHHSPALALRYPGVLPQTVAPLPAATDTGYYRSPNRHWNIKAVAALPVAVASVVVGFAFESALLLLCGGAIAFTLGLIGSRQCRDREDRGKGLAIAGMVLGAATLFLGVVALLLGS